MMGENRHVVEKWMETELLTLHPSQSISDALQLFIESNKACLPVVEQNYLVGVLTATECLKYLCMNTQVVESVNHSSNRDSNSMSLEHITSHHPEHQSGRSIHQNQAEYSSGRPIHQNQAEYLRERSIYHNHSEHQNERSPHYHLNHQMNFNIDLQIEAIYNRSYPAVTYGFPMQEVRQTPLYVLDPETQKLAGEINEHSFKHWSQTLRTDLQKVKDENIWYKRCFDTAYEGLVAVDDQGVIQLFNETYGRFVGVPVAKAVGEKAKYVIENTRLPVVLKTGVPERSQAHRLQGQNLVVHRLPIWEENKVVGAVGMLVYEGISEIYQVIERMEQLEKDKKRHIRRVSPLKKTRQKVVRFEDILGESPAISETKKIARKAARSRATVLITGESGVGKEQFSRAIHDMGITSGGNFVSVNCAAIPDTLLESELFGYEKGAFTGANQSGKIGKFEQAHNGTLLLDEIGDMPLSMQAKILRVLQEKKIERIGGTTPIPVNFRLIAATNKNLKQMVETGEFREDLYYRLDVIPIHIPPLRDRKQDIPIIVAKKMQELAAIYETKDKTIDQQILQLLYKHDWPGNVRELINVLERLFVLTDENHIEISEFLDPLLPQLKTAQLQPEFKWINRRDDHVDDEKEAIKTALKITKGNKSRAAKILGISRATLYNRLSRLGVETFN